VSCYEYGDEPSDSCATEVFVDDVFLFFVLVYFPLVTFYTSPHSCTRYVKLRLL
jgi:hypothetical protein